VTWIDDEEQGGCWRDGIRAGSTIGDHYGRELGRTASVQRTGKARLGSAMGATSRKEYPTSREGRRAGNLARNELKLSDGGRLEPAGEEDTSDMESRGPVATASLREMEKREGARKPRCWKLGTERWSPRRGGQGARPAAGRAVGGEAERKEPSAPALRMK